MANIRKLREYTGDKPWRLDYYDNQGKRKRQHFRTKREAETVRSKIETDLNRGTYIDRKLGESTTVAQLWERYLYRLETVGASGRGATGAKTLQTYRVHAGNYILPRWEHYPLSNITYADVSEWVTSLQSKKTGDGVGPETRKAVGRLFVAMLDFATQEAIIPRNPARDAAGRTPFIPGGRELKRARSEPVFLTMPQLVELSRHAEPWSDLILFLGTTGLRWGEVSALRARDLDLDPEMPSVRVERAYAEVTGAGMQLGPTKTGEARTVPLMCDLLPQLQNRIDDAGGEDGLLFPSRDGTPLRNTNVTRRVLRPAAQRLAESASTPREAERLASLGFHDLRHTAISLAIKLGCNVKTVQRIAGHATATVTLDRYGHLYPDDLHDVARGMSGLLMDTGWTLGSDLAPESQEVPMAS